MYCPYCGAENNDQARFCKKCGSPMQQQTSENPDQSGTAYGAAGEKNREFLKKKRKKWPLILMLIILLIAACVVGGIFVFRHFERKHFEGYVKTGQKYLEELDYEKAEDSYLAAIEIDPKQPEPYLRLADVYIAQGEEKKAENILKQGAEETETPEIAERYSLYTYVDDVVIPEEGRCEEGEFICEYFDGEHMPVLEGVDSLSGVLTSRIRDFDGDGNEELLVLLLKNEKADWDFYDDYMKYNCNIVYLRMYEQEKGTVVLQDEETGIYPVLGVGDYEQAGVFLKQTEEAVYICGSSENQTNFGLEGTELYSSFVMSYDGTEFVRHAGYEQPVDYWGTDDLRPEDMAGVLDGIGMEDQAAYVRDIGISVFDFSVEPGEMLMLVTGENDGSGDSNQYVQDLTEGEMRPELLGNVVYTLKLIWEEEKDEANPADEEDGQTYTDGESLDYESQYGPLLDEAYETYGDNIFFICDIDKDGIKELLLQTGAGEAEYIYQVYTISDGKNVLLGEIGGLSTSYFLDEQGGKQDYIIQRVTYPRMEQLFHISIEKGVVSEELVSDKENMGAEEEYYTNDYPVPYAYVSDKSLLQ